MSLKEKAIKGLAWNTIGSVGTGLCNLAITIILARLLTPSDFGLLAILVVFTVLSETLIESGFGQALIQDKKATSDDLNTVFYTNICIATLLYLALFLSAPLIAGFYENESLINLSRFVFLALIFNALSIIQKTIFSKNINFKATAASSLAAVTLSGVVAIGLALKGFGVWALATHLVLNAFFQMVFLWGQSQWRPSGSIRVKSLKKYIPFSAPLLAQGFVDKFVTNLETLLIGKFYTVSDLGFFSQSRNLNSYFMQTISGVVQRVTYPVLVKINNDNSKLKEGYRQVIGTTMLVMIPLALGMMAAAENIVLVLFGAKWLQTAKYLQYFVIMGLFVSLHSYYTNIFLVLGKTGKFLQLSLIKQFLKVAIVAYLVNESVTALVMGVTAVGILTSLMYIYFGGKLINYSLIELFLDLKQIILTSAFSAILVFVFGWYFASANVFLILFMQIITMVSVYVLLLLLMRNTYFFEVFYLVKKMVFKQA